MKRTITALAAAVAVLGFTAGPALAKKQAAPATATITELAVTASGGGALDDNSADYDILVQALLETGLAGVLAGPGEFTVFAPNDLAFQRTVQQVAGLDALPSEAETFAAVAATFGDDLDDVLLYHVTGGTLSTVDVLRSRTLTTVEGGAVRPRGINLRDETSALRDPRLVLAASNLYATNGVIHTIDRVLVPDLS
jgi:uncharacterized surface protein with fasciclin (FAS1) repeats